ncbi:MULTISPECIES: maleylpyruvate isomerase family mycothiol-dependent enzyme [unclassified Streptomyces]|uniref:maleylpyruvate isomerase family mycothiol-dependent enzyme n=1 Tax=unclassified Streptomyces TaxID=2593676 RepID=UPI000B8220B3|nr:MULTISPECIES: maleylpyruvate isomerase family mycothiol-dependent enzyme [unclassified Streptomyces]MYS24024.1 maleylpyruvate isomerase family mycothiol-dependent enzyme [Streptomyces sp. SID4948]
MTTSHFALPALPFEHWLARIEERSAAFRDAVGAADPQARVPGCPDWTTRDLAAHLGGVQRFWAATVSAGPARRPPSEEAVADREPTGELLAWSARSTALLLDALRAAGPDTPCWTWWAASGRPATAGAVARHQVQEAAVHTRDAQEAAGAPEPLPPAVALDALDEFLQVGFGSMDGWPHSPARVVLAADEGPAWTLILDPTGASAVRGGDGPRAGAVLAGPASDLLLALYRRVPWDGAALRLTGDPELVRQLVVWPPLG